MANRLSNMAGLFKDTRTRIILLTTLSIVLITIVVGFFIIRGRATGGESAVGVAQTPQGLKSIPFQAPNKEYAALQEKQNVEQAKQAEQSQGSAIPTIVNAENNPPPPTDNAGAGVGFTGLSRQQSDAGTFTPKALPANGQEAAQNSPNCPVTPESKQQIYPIYTETGRLIGESDAAGKIYDANNQNIGMMGSDGLARDLSGKVMGSTSIPLSGTPVFTNDGKVVGYSNQEGKIQSPDGKIIGTPSPDGVLRDVTGKTVGQLGIPVYDAQSKLVGFADNMDKVRTPNGQLMGSLDTNNVARDNNGNIIGKAGIISPGTSAYGPSGNVIGKLGPDGKLRDQTGNIVGLVSADGEVKNVQGKPVGTVSYSPPNVAAPNTVAPSTGLPGSQQILPPAPGVTPQQQQQQATEQANQKQQIILNDQQLQQQVQEKQQAMSSQANQLLTAWSSPVQQYVPGQEQTSNNASSGSGGGSSANSSGSNGGQQQGGNTSTAQGAALVKAGTVLYAIMNTAVNSDEPGPVMATVTNGPFKGAKLLGTLSNQGQAVAISFNVLTLPAFSKSLSVSAVAIDQNTARTALSTYTDNHYLLRYGSLFAAAFVQGYGQALMAGGTTSTNGLSTNTTGPDLSAGEKFYVALGNVGTQFSNQMSSVYNTPPTVYVASGTAVGILFLSDVTVPTS